VKVTIDQLTAAGGWSGPAGSSFTLNQHTDYIAEYLPASLIIHIPANSLGQSFTKSLGTVDLSACTEIVMSVWSRELRRVNTNDPADYFYTIQFDGTHQFMLPTNLAFESVTFGINGWTSANQITIKPTTNAEDWIIISGCYGLWDDLPLDIMMGMQMGIQQAITTLLPNGLAIGTASCLAGDASLVPSATTYLERGAVISITGGGHSETHQVERFDETGVWFTSLFDGKTMLYPYTGGAVALTIPVRFGTMEKEAAIPSISIWGMAPKDNQDTQDTFIVQDSMDPTGAAALRRAPWMQNFTMIVDCEARSAQLLALASRCARMFLASSRCWINGRAHDMPYPEPSVYVDPEEAVAMIPKVQYTIEIEIHEERSVRVWAQPVTGQTLTYTQKQGKLGTVNP
jgi:hypothetical protein